MVRQARRESAVTTYAHDVVEQRVVTGALVRQACERHLRDLSAGHQRGLSWDDVAAEKAIDFFGFVKHSKGEWAGQPFRLEPWQAFIVGSLFGWKRADKTRRFRTAYIECSRKNGKALALDTPLPTPDGWTTMGQVQPGDTLFDERGQTCRVIAATDVMLDRPCYEVVFSDGSRIVADAEHEWLTRTRRKGNGTCGKRRTPADDIHTTAELASMLRVANPYSLVCVGARQIVAANPIPSVPVRCVQVDSPSQLYLAGKSYIPTHNSTLMAGLGLLLAFFDGEPGAEAYAAATKRDQAKILWSEARQMVLKTEALRKRITPLVGNLHDVSTRSKFEPLGADADSMDGLNIHGAVVDELHAHKTRAIVDVLETATGARRQPLITYITTAGTDRDSVCYERHEYGAKVVNGVVEDDSYFAYIAAIDEGDDWQDESVWRKANPNLDVSVKLDDLRRKAERAKQIPTEQNAFMRLHLDVWTQQQNRWIPLHLWDANAGVGPLNEADFRGRTCHGGLDLSAVRDLTAWVLVFPDQDDPEALDVLPRFWCPESWAHSLENRYSAQYQAWDRRGFLTITPGDAIDYEYVRAAILEDAAKFRIVDLNVDRLFQSHETATKLQAEGLEVFPMGQGFLSMAAPMKELERRLLAKKIRHHGHPVLRFMADNLAVSQDPAGNLKPNKANSQSKIDGIVALVMAVDRAMRRQPAARSRWEDEDAEVLRLS